MNKEHYAKGIIIGALIIGVLGGAPLSSCLCCMWALLGGGVAALIVCKSSRFSVSVGEGLFLGLMAGILGAILATVISIASSQLLYGGIEAQQKQILDALNEAFKEMQLPPEINLDQIDETVANLTSVVIYVVTFFMFLIIYSIFGLLGGLIAAAIWGNKSPGYPGPGYPGPGYPGQYPGGGGYNFPPPMSGPGQYPGGYPPPQGGFPPPGTPPQGPPPGSVPPQGNPPDSTPGGNPPWGGPFNP